MARSASARAVLRAVPRRGVWSFVALLALLALLSLSTAPLAFAGPFDPGGHDWEGYADMTRLVRDGLGSARGVVTNRIDWSSMRPDDALVLVFPASTVDVRSTGAFVRAGGRLALFDDFGAGDDLLRSFDIRRVPLPAHPRLMLRDNPDLAIAEPGPAPQALTLGVERVVTNHASGLLQPLLTTTLRVLGGGGDGEEVPVALSGSAGQGRLLFVGDPSIAMNSMLRYPGNHAFMTNALEYLMEGHPGGRLYLVVGGFAEAGVFAGPDESGNPWLAALERARSSVVHEGLDAWILYWLSLVVGTVVLAWLLPRAVRAYRAGSPRFTRATATALQGGAAGRAAALGAPQAYRGHAMLEWRRALVESLATHFALPGDPSPAELVRRVAELGSVPREALRELERLLLRMAEIDTMIAARQTHALDPVRDEEVIAAGALIGRVLDAVAAPPTSGEGAR